MTENVKADDNGVSIFGRNDVKYVLGIIIFLIQLAGLVWGAAKIDSSVESLERSTENLTKAVDNMDNSIDDLTMRVRVLEDRTAVIKRGGME